MNQKILYTQYTNPAGYPPLEHSSRILARKGWRVLFLGTGAFAADNLRFPNLPNIDIHQIPFCRGGWRQKFHYLWFCIWVIGWVLLWRPQWIYASDPLSCPLALLLSSFLGLKVIYHEHDSPGVAKSKFMKLVGWTRRMLAHHAPLCVLPNEKRTEQFGSEMGNGHHLVSVWNCPAQEEVSEPRLPHKGPNLWVLYHGSIVPLLLPVTVIRALALLPDCVKLRVIGYETVGHVGYIRKLQEVASKIGVHERLEILGPMPRQNLLRYARKCDVGLGLISKWSEDPNLRFLAGASNKPFDYLACGLSLLVTDLPDWKEMYVEPGYGLACDPDNAESIAEALKWFLDHPAEMREMGERGRQRILTEWNYERQFDRIINILNKL